MPDSSDSTATVLAKVRPRQIYCLLDIVHTASLRDSDFIAARFDERARYFAETLRFLEDIGWLRSENNTVLPAHDAVAQIASTAASQRDFVLAQVLFDAPGPYLKTFATYLAQFERHDLELVYHPTMERRLRESAVRDFLMELGAVAHRTDGDFYVLADPFAHLGFWARNNLRPSSEADFTQRAEERRMLGRAAELLALEWERRRVGPKWANDVRHISERSPSACYDIQSVTIDGPQPEPRFIEVKAVAGDSFQFHWSTAEIEAAQVLRQRYFLYLLPVQAPDTFDIERMEVIQNPYSAVYQDTARWLKSEADIICEKSASFGS